MINFIKRSYSIFKIKNASGTVVNPATEEKQDTSITSLQLIDNLYGALLSVNTDKIITSSGVFDQDNYFSEFLLETAAKDMAVDGTTPKVYRYTVPASTEVLLSRSMITIEDGASAFLPGNFGAIAGALANGVEVSITPSGGAKVILETWTNNREVRNTFFDFDQSFKTAGQYVGRWTFSKDLSNSGLTLSAGDVFDVTIQDNLTALDYMSFRIKGRTKAV